MLCMAISISWQSISCNLYMLPVHSRCPWHSCKFWVFQTDSQTARQTYIHAHTDRQRLNIRGLRHHTRATCRRRNKWANQRRRISNRPSYKEHRTESTAYRSLAINTISDGLLTMTASSEIYFLGSFMAIGPECHNYSSELRTTASIRDA